ncbi:MAG TPA: hypothetical protein VMW75_21330, partial [Thermoanaerobaculia bacterium]|nr:hypothetical protein [Thermoanaerobaculia bacterium]
MKLSSGPIWALWVICVLLLIGLGTCAWPYFALPVPVSETHEAQLVAVAPDLSSITVGTTPAAMVAEEKRLQAASTKATEDAAAAQDVARTTAKTAAAAAAAAGSAAKAKEAANLTSEAAKAARAATAAAEAEKTAVAAQKAAAAAEAKMAAALKSGLPGPDTVIPATGNDAAAKALHAQLQAKTLAPHDLLSVGNQPTPPAAQPSVEVERLPIGAWRRLVTFLGATLVVLGFGLAALGKNFGKLVVGLDGRTSNSKTQLALWFLVVMVTYLSTLWLRFCASGNLLLGAITIPNNLLLLSGMSAFSFAGAKAITQGKQNALAGAGNTDAMKTTADQDPSLSDLVQDDFGNADFGDTQMLFVTLIAAI